MEIVSTSETSVNLLEITMGNVPEDKHLHEHGRENLKSQHVQGYKFSAENLTSPERQATLIALIPSSHIWCNTNSEPYDYIRTIR
jgi:hypothetical protein